MTDIYTVPGLGTRDLGAGIGTPASGIGSPLWNRTRLQLINSQLAHLARRGE
jgi:hypothetical protein